MSAAPLPRDTPALTEQSFESPLHTLPSRQPVAVGVNASLAEGLQLMQARGTGSVMVLDEAGRAVGILTRHDLLPRVALRQPPLDIARTPIAEVMSSPVHTVEAHRPVQDAALAMARHGIRHVPITQDGRVVNLVSERDLFALQRRSIRQLGAALRQAAAPEDLVRLAPGIREFAAQLHGQGVAARPLTDLVSHLNDTLTERLFELLAAAHALDVRQACWVAFGSEGRGEQTVSTDQDNGLVLDDAVDEAGRERWLALAREANQWLDACGYPLCKGGVMAGNPACCLSQSQWAEKFSHWMAHGEPQDLLNASIHFDIRALAGRHELVEPLRERLLQEAPGSGRFLRLMAENSLKLRPALTWWGGLDTVAEGGHRWIDLKLNGTAVFVDGARLMALAQGVGALGTRERLEQAGQRSGANDAERATWLAAFDVLQRLRLRVQLGSEGASASAAAAAAASSGNRIDLKTLDGIDRRMLKEAMRTARSLQQRLQMEWLRG